MKKLESHSAPFLYGKSSTSKIMLCVILALMPSVLTGCLNYGLKAVILLGVTTGVAMLSEAFIRIVTRRPQTVFDFSAAVTGLMLGMMLPPEFPVKWAAAGSMFAIIIVKQLFGGIGRNFANPALTARMLLMLVFMQEMFTWTTPGGTTVTGTVEMLPDEHAPLWDLFLGNTAGGIGETCALGLLLGGLFLCIAQIISPAAPVAYLGSFAALTFIGGYDVPSQLLSGSLLLCAVFAACDYSTTPVTKGGKVLFGLCCGGLTYLIRHYGGYAESAPLSVLIMNLFTPMLDHICSPRPFGMVRIPKKRKAKQEHAA